MSTETLSTTEANHEVATTVASSNGSSEKRFVEGWFNKPLEAQNGLSFSQICHLHDKIVSSIREKSGDNRLMRDDYRDSVANSGQDTAYGLHMADVGTSVMEREKLHYKIDRNVGSLESLEHALERMVAGTYGICHCERKIPFGRLDGQSDAPECIDCTQAREARELNLPIRRNGRS